MKTDRKSSLALGYIGQIRTYGAHHRFPVFAALRMKVEFYWNDNDVLERIIDAAKYIGEMLVPWHAIR
ncbi:MAG TPA: hypothetical protein VJM31_12505 [Vicinamibacterales bacterium]|nr:hypothetical protein [Vicinamibacterales bacterium]